MVPRVRMRRVQTDDLADTNPCGRRRGNMFSLCKGMSCTEGGGGRSSLQLVSVFIFISRAWKECSDSQQEVLGC